MLIYRIASGLGLGLGLRWLDDELAVYQPERRQTHLLDRQGGELLELLACWPEAGPGPASDAQAIARQLLTTGSADAIAADDLAEALAQLAPMLDELARLGLVLATPC